MNFTILRFNTIDSTNTEALKQARLGAPEGLCIVARQQTAGRGRHGRVWVSPPDAGLYFSVVLKPRIEPQYLPLITLMSGVAVHDALSELGLKTDIKWVNDVLVGEKKICGILAETAETAQGVAVVVGIGINLTSSNFPPEIADTATSIEESIGESARIKVADVESLLVRFLGHWYSVLNAQGGTGEILNAWRERSSYFSNKSVRITLGNESINGVTDGLEPNGALRVRLADGSVRIVHAGDVERLRAE